MLPAVLKDCFKDQVVRTKWSQGETWYYYKDVYQILGVTSLQERAQLNCSLKEDLDIENFEWLDEATICWIAIKCNTEETRAFRWYFFKKIYSELE